MCYLLLVVDGYSDNYDINIYLLNICDWFVWDGIVEYINVYICIFFVKIFSYNSKYFFMV